jgi:hypothetical protein
LAHPKKLGGYKNIGAFKIFGGYQNLGASKIFGGCQNLGVSKIFGGCQNLGASKIFGAYRNIGTAGKVGRPAEELPYCLGSAEAATADFSQAPLMVSFSSLLMFSIADM